MSHCCLICNKIITFSHHTKTNYCICTWNARVNSWRRIDARYMVSASHFRSLLHKIQYFIQSNSICCFVHWPWLRASQQSYYIPNKTGKREKYSFFEIALLLFFLFISPAAKHFCRLVRHRASFSLLNSSYIGYLKYTYSTSTYYFRSVGKYPFIWKYNNWDNGRLCNVLN